MPQTRRAPDTGDDTGASNPRYHGASSEAGASKYLKGGKSFSCRKVEFRRCGIESKGLEAPPASMQARNYTQIFEPFDTRHRFDELDGGSPI